ncbi:VOC family protein [Leeuwenhoekiella sp. A16]|uniref:VOC family protein n=1 Tax=unclassified Leeuwenhoekiella TaxID=2615029 RepID=UPI003A807A81
MKRIYSLCIPLILILIVIVGFTYKKEDKDEKKLGHIVLQVSNLKTSQDFYKDVLNMKTHEQATYQGKTRVFLASGDDEHHELVLQERKTANDSHVNTRYLQQLAFELNDHATLVDFYKQLKNKNIALQLKNNQISWSLYFYDPDSVQIELYWDVRNEPFGKTKFKGNQKELSEDLLLNPPK